MSWIDYTSDPTVTGSSTNQRIWRYSVNSSTGNETWALCSKILLGKNSATVTLNSNGASENITNTNTSFAWFYIGESTKLFFLNGNYYDSQPKIAYDTSNYNWTQISSANDNYKSGTKYTLNTSSGSESSISTGALNFSTKNYANDSIKENEYVSLSNLFDEDNSSVGLYYFNGIFYTTSPSKQGGGWSSYSSTSSDNTKYSTIYGVDRSKGKVTIGSGNLHLNNGTITISSVNYNLKNSTSYYAEVFIGSNTLYYFNGTFYIAAPDLKSETQDSEEYVIATSNNPLDRFYTSNSSIMSRSPMAKRSNYYYAGFGNYWVATGNGVGSYGPITYWSDDDVDLISQVENWYDSGTIYATINNASGYMDFDSGKVYRLQTTLSTKYTGYTAPSTLYKAEGTYNYTYRDINYRIIIKTGKFSSHQYQNSYSYSTPDTKANSTYYYTSGSNTYRIVISSGSYSSHEKRGAAIKTYHYEPTGNLLNSGENGFQTNVGEYSGIYRYYFSEGSFTGIKVQSITSDDTHHRFSTPSNSKEGYTDFYFWTKNADISSSARGSSGTRITIYNNNSNGRIGLYFNSSGKLIKVRKSYPTDVDPTDFKDFLIFRSRSIWEGPSKGGSWNENFGLVFINGYLYKISSTLGTQS